MAGSRRDQVIVACGAKPGAAEDYPFGDEVAVFKVAGRMLALVSLAHHRAASAPSVTRASRGAFLSARISRVAFGTDNRPDVAKYVIAVELPSHAAHSEHDADPGFHEFNRLADLLQPEDPPVYGGLVLRAV